MPDLRKLALAPDQANYAVSEAVAANVYIKLEGGAGRVRRDYQNAAKKVDLQWTADADEYIYLRAFHNVLDDGALPFRMDLIVDNFDALEHVCRFVPDSFRLVSKEGNKYLVKASIEVTPRVPDDEYDEGLVTSFEAFGAEGSAAFSILAKIVNVDMPPAFGGDAPA